MHTYNVQLKLHSNGNVVGRIHRGFHPPFDDDFPEGQIISWTLVS